MLITHDTIREARQRIAPYIRKTPGIPFEFGESEIYLKCETLQRTGSFKIRGAANCILHNLAQAKQCGVVAASAGNHAQGVASMCRILGIKATIVMPTTTPPIKVQNTLKWGAAVELVGLVYNESFEHATRLASAKGLLFIHPFKDAHIIAGQGTLGLEMLEEPWFENVEALVAPVGGGGLINGVAIAVKQARPDIRIYGVGTESSAALYKAYKTGLISEEPVRHTLSDGVTQKKADEMMVNLLQKNVDDFFLLSEEAIAHAISVFAEQGKMIVEGAGAIPLAAVLENKIPEKRVALVVSGGNIDTTALYRVLQHELVKQGRNVRLNIAITDRPGGLHAITQVLAEQGANILQVFHQRASLKMGIGEAEVEADLETRGADHTLQIIDALTAKGFQVQRAT